MNEAVDPKLNEFLSEVVHSLIESDDSTVGIDESGPPPETGRPTLVEIGRSAESFIAGLDPGPAGNDRLIAYEAGMAFLVARHARTPFGRREALEQWIEAILSLSSDELREALFRTQWRNATPEFESDIRSALAGRPGSASLLQLILQWEREGLPDDHNRIPCPPDGHDARPPEPLGERSRQKVAAVGPQGTRVRNRRAFLSAIAAAAVAVPAGIFWFGRSGPPGKTAKGPSRIKTGIEVRRAGRPKTKGDVGGDIYYQDVLSVTIQPQFSAFRSLVFVNDEGQADVISSTPDKRDTELNHTWEVNAEDCYLYLIVVLSDEDIGGVFQNGGWLDPDAVRLLQDIAAADGDPDLRRAEEILADAFRNAGIPDTVKFDLLRFRQHSSSG